MSDSAPDPAPNAEAMRLLLTTAPPDVARSLARTLVEEHLAACVNLVSGVRSVYRWEGAIQDDPETLLVVKTARAAIPGLAARIRALHPYAVPEVVVLTPEDVSPPYLAWLLAAVAPPVEDT